MTPASAGLSAPLDEPWPWPFELALYDCSPALTQAERLTLRSLVQRWSEGDSRRFRDVEEQILGRLLRPLREVAAYLHAKPKWVVHPIVTHMGLGACTFWAWSAQHWEQVLCTELPACREAGYFTAPLLAAAYLLGHFTGFAAVQAAVCYRQLAERIFGPDQVRLAVERVLEVLRRLGFSQSAAARNSAAAALCYSLLINRSPRLEDLTSQSLETARRSHRRWGKRHKAVASYQVALSRALVELGILERPLPRSDRTKVAHEPSEVAGVHPEWVQWCRRWRELSTLQGKERIYGLLLGAGLWLAAIHPEVSSPAEWTPPLCAEFVAAMAEATIGQWVRDWDRLVKQKIGAPLSPRARANRIYALRKFFRDLQGWELIEVRLKPGRDLATPASIYDLIGPAPRVIDEAIWLKLVWASLHLAASDLPRQAHYPFEMVRAVAVVWTHAALRSDEIGRLCLGCVRPQREEEVDPETGERLAPGSVCYLEVPSNKTSPPYVKPVSVALGEAVAAWQALRPVQPAVFDRKSGEPVELLFSLRGRGLGRRYINKHLIPLLCAKAGVPERDARGRITSHRARASMLNHLKRGMTLFELQHYAGHRSPLSTVHYYEGVEPTALARTFVKADKTARRIEVLLDREAVTSGVAAAGESFLYYDLGHSYCTNAYWSTCPHRMACAGCDFNVPKASARGQALAAKAFLERFQQEVPLTEEEQEALSDDLAKWEAMLARLEDVPTPDGRTPRELKALRKKYADPSEGT